MKKLLLLTVFMLSASSYALLPYLDFNLGYERQMTSITSFNAYGAELDLGMDMMFMFGAEVYFGMLYNNSFNNHDMHLGLRGKVNFFDLAFAKAGLGMEMANSNYNFEMLGSVGAGFPIMPLINATVSLQYRRVFSSLAINSFGVYAGLNFSF